MYARSWWINNKPTLCEVEIECNQSAS